MKRIPITSQCLVLVLLCSLSVSLAMAQSEAQAGDELRIEYKNDTNRTASVLIGEPMRVWTQEHKRYTARLKAVKDISFVMGEIEVPVASVVKVKAYSKEIGSQRMKNWARRSAWTFAGGIALALLGLLLAFLLGTPGLIPGIVIIAIGLATAAICLVVLAGAVIALMGGNIPATSFKLDDWRLRLIRRKR